MSPTLVAIFFASGAAALLFETLWFRQAGLMLGNSVWTTSLVTASFMAGLALGNALAARYAGRLRRPLMAYAVIEAIIGTTGFGLVLLFPALTEALAPLLRALPPRPELLNALRLALAFVLMGVPATAMGATLPLLVGAMSLRDRRFGRVLGLLYGWNTLGAVAGALGGEAVLIGQLGVRGTGLAAAALNGLAALGAALLARRWPGGTETPEPAGAPAPRLAGAGRLLLAAAFLCGALLLALEVVWFRFLLLFVVGSSLTFAVMLAVVLLGIGSGGLLAAALLRVRPAADALLPWIALAAAFAAAHSYVAFAGGLAGSGDAFLFDAGPILLAALRLMLPVSLLSGLLFTLLGKALKDGLAGEARAAGWLTLANTTGAMAGSLAAGFLLLPRLGMERSFFVLALAYGVVSALVFLSQDRAATRRERRALAAAGALFGAYLSLFPFGLMRRHYLEVTAARWSRDGSRIAAIREGLTETVLYLRRELFGEPTSYRLLTNGLSMSASAYASQRYMKLYVYWPVALHPNPRRALLISYGVGSTAKALTDTRQLESIDVVDVSRDVLELGRIVFPAPAAYPLDDPRVRVHVEDGRFFLLSSDASYDIITGEPPPPKSAGIVNLYTREYFALLHARLAPGGMATYWLPVAQLEPREALAVVRGFCEAFADCSLWSGWGPEWMLAGTRGAHGPVSEAAFESQWREPRVLATLRDLGLEAPERLGATFIADAADLRELISGVPALDDDHPLRLSHRLPDNAHPFFHGLAEARAARERFARSELVARLWPAGWRERTLEAFASQELVDRFAWAAYGAGRAGIAEVHALLSQPAAPRTPVLWMLGASAIEERIARAAAERGIEDGRVQQILGAAALADRDFSSAERRYRLAQRQSSGEVERFAQARVLALLLAGERRRAAELLIAADEWIEPADRGSWDFFAGLLGTQPPFEAPAARLRD
jgi:predicted membrane-bound spermidine synthase